MILIQLLCIIISFPKFISLLAVVSMLLTLKVAKLGDKNIDPTHFVPGSPEYQRLNYEASHAVRNKFIFINFCKRTRKIYFEVFVVKALKRLMSSMDWTIKMTATLQ